MASGERGWGELEAADSRKAEGEGDEAGRRARGRPGERWGGATPEGDCVVIAVDIASSLRVSCDLRPETWVACLPQPSERQFPPILHLQAPRSLLTGWEVWEVGYKRKG